MFAENGSPVVLLCWGQQTCCSILPVPVPSPEDEVAAWGKIHEAWYATRGRWRKYLPGFGIVRVNTVEIYQGKSEFVGMYTERDIPSETQSLQQTMMDNYDKSLCIYDPYTGDVKCLERCICCHCAEDSKYKDECPTKSFYDACRDFTHMNTISMIRHVFSNPALAASNDFLKKDNLIYSHNDVLTILKSHDHQPCPALRQLEFRAILIREGWELDKTQFMFPFMVTLFLGVVVAASFLFGWDTAWAVGSFFVALVTLLCMRAAYMSS
ncbi:hypothetical protein BJX61DRAFT_537052 [Aspergillus egyptiacus]|nr:hypothetical protein BJX61DRAFT_537052 [Aspergillus egyptiacus]